MESGKTIALAGIIATAVVGIAAAGSSLLISRDDRSNQRSLAHEDRVYARRAGAYEDALKLLLQLDRGLKGGKTTSEIEALFPQEALDVLEARLRAYASRRAWKSFLHANELARRALPLQASKGANSRQAIARFGHAADDFSEIVSAEVG